VQALDVGHMTEDEVARNREMQRALSEERGVYRRNFRHSGKVGNAR